MTCHSKITRGTLPPRAVDQWHGVKEDHDAMWMDDDDGKTAREEEEATMDMLVFVLAVVLLAVVLGVVWMGGE